MAKFEGGFLRGILGNYSYRVVNGVQLVSALPDKGSVKHTEDTQRASCTFGMASAFGAQIRKSVSTQILNFNDGSLNNRLTSALVKILNVCRDPLTASFAFESNSFAKLTNLEYNINSPVHKLLKVQPDLALEGNRLTMCLPDLNIPKQLKFYGDTFRCKITVLVSLFRLREGKAARLPLKEEVVVTRNKTVLPSKDFVFEVPQGCLCIVSLFMEYSVAGNLDWEPVTSRKFNPGMICGAVITEGEYPDKSAKGWLKMLAFS